MHHRTPDSVSCPALLRPVAYHCCSYNDSKSLEAAEFVKSVAAMLAVEVPAYAIVRQTNNKVRKVLEDPSELTRDSSWPALRDGVLQPLAEISGGGQQLESVFGSGSGIVRGLLVVDALDEALCLDNSGQPRAAGTVVDLLANAITDPVWKESLQWLSLVCTSRDEARVNNLLAARVHTTEVALGKAVDESDESGAGEVIGDDQQEKIRAAVSNDLKQYIEARLKQSDSLGSRWAMALHRRAEADNSEALVEELVKASTGVLLWLEMVLDDVQSVLDDEAAVQALTELRASGMQSLYLRRFERQYPDADFAYLKPILEVMIASLRPLAPEDLFAACTLCKQVSEGGVASALGDFVGFRQCLAKLKGYVAHGSNGTVALFHGSLAEWLKSSESEHSFLCSEARGHAMLAGSLLCLFCQSSAPDHVCKDLGSLSLTTSTSPLHAALLALGLQTALPSQIPSTASASVYDLVCHLTMSDIRGGDAAVSGILNSTGIDVNDPGEAYGTPLILAVAADRMPVVKALLGCKDIQANRGVGELGITPLHAAASLGRTEAVKALLACERVEFNKVDEEGSTPLHTAANQGRTEAVKALLACERVEVNQTDLKGITPLCTAAALGWTEAVQALLACERVQVNQADEEGSTPLRTAANQGRTEAVKALLACERVEVNKPDHEGRTPLSTAANQGRTEAVQALLACERVEVNQTDLKGITPLYAAANQGRTEAVKALLACERVEVNQADEEGITPLCTAANQGQTEAVQALLACERVEVNQPNHEGITPLCTAANQGHTEAVRALLACERVEVNQADLKGRTPLLTAAYLGETEAVQALLACERVEVNKPDHEGITPLYTAANLGWTEAVQALLACERVEVNRADHEGITPLRTAANLGQTEAVQALLACERMEVNQADHEGITPLYAAANQGWTQVVQALLACDRVEVNQPDHEGITPLYTAANLGWTEAVQALLACERVEVNKPDLKGRTPLWIAAALGRTEAVRALLACERVEVNQADEEGITPLLIAANQGRTEAVQALLACERVEVNQADQEGRTPLYAAAYLGETEAVQALLACERVEVNKTDQEGSTPLRVAAYLGRIEALQALLACGRCDKSDIKAASRMLEQGCKMPPPSLPSDLQERWRRILKILQEVHAPAVKQNPNEICACGSGKKHKKCCMSR